MRIAGVCNDLNTTIFAFVTTILLPFNTEITTRILDRLEYMYHTIHNSNNKHCEYSDISSKIL